MVRFRTRSIGPTLKTASATTLLPTASLLIRNRSRLGRLMPTTAHDYSATIDRDPGIGQLPVSVGTDTSTEVGLQGLNEWVRPELGPHYIFLGGMPVPVTPFVVVSPPNTTYFYNVAIMLTPLIDDYCAFLGIPVPQLSPGSSIDVPMTMANSYGYDPCYPENGEGFSWIFV